MNLLIIKDVAQLIVDMSLQFKTFRHTLGILTGLAHGVR